MGVWAFSGVANPLKLYTQGASNVAETGDKTYTYTINVTDGGTIQAFLATVNISNFSTFGGTGTITCSVKRNGVALATSTTDIAFFETNIVRGVCFYETLNFLAGGEVQPADVFALEIVVDQAVAQTITFDAAINLAVIAKPRQFEL